jgi:acyl carrier protein
MLIPVRTRVMSKIAEWTDSLSGDAQTWKDLGIDSLELVSIVIEIEGETGIPIPDAAVAEMKTVGDLIRYVEVGQEVVAKVPSGG